MEEASKYWEGYIIYGGLTVDQGGGHLSAVVNTDMIWGAGASARYAFGQTISTYSIVLLQDHGVLSSSKRESLLMYACSMSVSSL